VYLPLIINDSFFREAVPCLHTTIIEFYDMDFPPIKLLVIVCKLERALFGWGYAY
jgi:hypothetical protein